MKLDYQGDPYGIIKCDWKLVRYLRARSMDVKKAELLFHKSMKQRAHYLECPEEIQKWFFTHVSSSHFTQLLSDLTQSRLPWYFRDKENRLAYFIRLGRLTKGNVRELGYKNMAHMMVWTGKFLEQDLETHFIENECTGSMKVHIVVDLDGFDMSSLALKDLPTVARSQLSVIFDIFPETVGFITIINAPPFIVTAWPVVAMFVPRNTRKRITVSGTNVTENATKLLKMFTPLNLPLVLGGACNEDGPYCPSRVFCSS